MRLLLLAVVVSASLVLPSGRGGPPAPKAAAHELPPKHFRLTSRELFGLGWAFVQELTFETPEPAKVTITMLHKGTGGGTVFHTKRQPGQRLARCRVILLLDYFSATGEKRFVTKSCLRFAVGEIGPDGTHNGGTASQLVGAPDANDLEDILRHKLKPGDYPFTGQDRPDGDGLELLSVGVNRIFLRVTDADLKGDTTRQIKSEAIHSIPAGELEAALNTKLAEGVRKALDLGVTFDVDLPCTCGGTTLKVDSPQVRRFKRAFAGQLPPGGLAIEVPGGRKLVLGEDDQVKITDCVTTADQHKPLTVDVKVEVSWVLADRAGFTIKQDGKDVRVKEVKIGARTVHFHWQCAPPAQ